jgi:hypothetical protein
VKRGTTINATLGDFARKYVVTTTKSIDKLQNLSVSCDDKLIPRTFITSLVIQIHFFYQLVFFHPEGIFFYICWNLYFVLITCKAAGKFIKLAVFSFIVTKTVSL